MKIKEIVDIQGYDKRARLMDLYTQGMDLLAGTEAWEKVQKEIHQLRKELGMNEGDYFSHDDPEYSDWHKFARLQDLYDLVDDGGNYDKEEVEAEVKWLRKELDMHPSERRGVAADTYKKGWSPHGHNARLENINEECGEGEYYCRKSGMCKPIPDGYKVTDIVDFEEVLWGYPILDATEMFLDLHYTWGKNWSDKFLEEYVKVPSQRGSRRPILMPFEEVELMQRTRVILLTAMVRKNCKDKKEVNKVVDSFNGIDGWAEWANYENKELDYYLEN